MSTCFTPNKISKIFGTEEFRNRLPESVKEHVKTLGRDGWRFYIVAQRRGRCYTGKKVITIPEHAIVRDDRDIGYFAYYVSHECSHAFVGPSHGHDAVFMEKLIEICPKEYVHYELGYMPRAAKKAGIGQLSYLDL